MTTKVIKQLQASPPGDLLFSALLEELVYSYIVTAGVSRRRELKRELDRRERLWLRDDVKLLNAVSEEEAVNEKATQ